MGAPALTLLTYNTPVATDVVPLQFRQTIGANDALRVGTYGKRLALTLSKVSNAAGPNTVEVTLST